MIMSLTDRNHTLMACTYDETDKKYFSDWYIHAPLQEYIISQSLFTMQKKDVVCAL